MKTLSLKFEKSPGSEVEPGCGSDLGVRRLTMRIGTNSSGPGGLIRRALRIGVLAGLAAGLVLALGLMLADAQAHGHGEHFGGGGWHGGWAGSDFRRSGGANFNRSNYERGSGLGGLQNRARENRNQGNRRQGSFARQQARQGRGNARNIRGAARFNNARSGQLQPRNSARPAMRQSPNRPGAMRPEYNPQSNMGRNMPGIRAGVNNVRPGQEHLPQWWESHRGLSPQQQADAMRREPGFRNLPQSQQQRLLNRLRNFDSRSPQAQRRMLNRVEMFERLPPERQQEVRGASAAFNRMPPQQKQRMIQAFQQLRHMPPAERDQMLHSGYGQQFTPQQRTVLGNLLSIEPYQPSSAAPYFGRPH
jgi:Protein of unknown function (DUF3106)